MRLIDADDIDYESIDSSDTSRYEYYYGTGIMAVRKEDIDIMPTIEPEQCWIPTSERLPEDDTVVLVCGKSGGVYTAIHNNSKTWIRGWWKLNSKNHHCNPTAWMPIPEPWKGEEHG